MTKKESIIILFSITLCWSCAYIFIKDIPAEFSIYAYLTLTSGVAGLILLFMLHRRLKSIDRLTFVRGLILSLLIMANMIFEKFGLDHLPASAVSTIASMNIVIVPLILIVMKQYPTRNQTAGIVIILGGILLSNQISLSGNDAGNLKGTVFVLLSCVMMSLYTVLAADYTKKSDPLLLTMLQMCLTALFGLVLWIITDPGSFTSIEWNGEVISYILLIALFSKCYAYVMLMLAEKYADALSVTIVASMDPVVTLLMAVLIPNVMGSTESFSMQSLLRAVIIALGAIVAGTHFLGGKENGATEESEIPPEETGQQAVPVTKELPSPLKTFVAILVVFAVLNIAINVMEFAEGYSEARPENLLPAVAGMLFGPIGAAACAVGNLLGDIPYLAQYGMTSILGLAANFLLAYIPYKIWYAMTDKEISMHTWKNILLFLWGILAGSMVCSCLLGYGLEMIFGEWQRDLIPISFVNNMVFSVALGLPLLIVMTSDDIGWGGWKKRFLNRKQTSLSRKSPRIPLWVLCVVFTVLGGILFIAGVSGVRMQQNMLLKGLAVLTVLLTAAVCVMPEKAKENGVRPWG